MGAKASARLDYYNLILEGGKSSADTLASKYQNLRAKMEKVEDSMWGYFYILPAHLRAALLTKIPHKIDSLEKLILEASTLEKSNKLKKQVNPGSSSSQTTQKQHFKGHSKGNNQPNGTARSS